MVTPSVFPTPSRTSAPGVYETMDQQAQAADDAPMSCGYFDRIEPSLMATFVPCFTIARFTTHGRLSFALVFLVVLVLYGGGIASYIMAARVTDPVIITGTTNVSGGWPLTPIFTVVRTAWATYILGLWATLAVDFFIWIVYQIRDAVHEDQEALYHISNTAINLLVVHFVAQLLLTVVMVTLFFKLRVQKPRSCCSQCLSFCGCCCCPSCALGCAIASARNAQVESHDEIPAYHV